jgi:CBS domain-containing protein
MTSPAECIPSDTNLIETARRMKELDVGSLPVCDNERLAGMITDRDLAIRGLAEGHSPATTTVRFIMSPEIVYIYDDQNTEDAARLMEVKQIRRLPVLNREKRLVGIVSLGDLAVNAGTALSGEALKEISQPVHSHSTNR